jgi:Xaa-Pro dipeptidase
MENQFGEFSLGPNTLTIPMTVHVENRQKLISMFTELKIDTLGKVILLESGKQLTRYDSDHELLFRQESYFQWVCGVKESDCYFAIDLVSGKSILFIQRLPPEYAIWMGTIKSPEIFKKIYMVDECYFVDEIQTVLSGKGCKTILIIHGENTDSKCCHHGATFPGIENFTVDKEILFPLITECRVIKSEKEIDILRYVSRASALAHCEIMRTVRPGMLEYEMESLFHHYVYSRYGCRNLAYTCICGSGINSAILHYGHAGAPNSRIIKDGDMLMFDMGGEYHCYCADISRSFPANGKFTQVQKEIYLSVLASQQAVLDTMKSGVMWPDMHRLAYRVICEQLKKYNFLKGDIEEMLANHVPSLFMPHGLGHFIGLETHDVGGYPKGYPERSKEPGLSRLRTARQLKKNMVITVEPGIYFIRTLLEPAFENPNISKFLNIEKIRENLDFGGVRIEDDVLVLENGCENLSTAAPRSIEEIEQLMASTRQSVSSNL